MRLDHLLSKEEEVEEDMYVSEHCLVFKSRETKIEDKTFLVLMRLGDTPVPIPNTMVKT